MPTERVTRERVVVANSGCGGYVCSKGGMWKLAVLICGCATFAIYASSRAYLQPNVKTYVLAAQIISWAVSLLLYFCKLTGLYVHLNTSCWSFDAFDYFWSWISSLNFLSCSILLACFFSSCDLGRCNGFCSCARELTALLLCLLTAIVYVFEAQHLRLFAPIGTSYGSSWRGVWKMFILVIGGTAFGLLIQTGYICRSRNDNAGCTSARTFVLVAWTVAWSVSALFYLLHICGVQARTTADGQYKFSAVEFFWSAFSCLLFLLGAAVLAGFLSCSRFTSRVCRIRLAADICGWVAAILFAIDAFQMRSSRPVWFIRTSAQPVGGTGRVQVTRTTETRTVRK